MVIDWFESLSRTKDIAQIHSFVHEIQGHKNLDYRYKAWNHLEKRIVFHTLCETFFLCRTNTEIQEKELKELFKDLYLYYPDYFNEASLQEVLLYFNTNSSATYI